MDLSGVCQDVPYERQPFRYEFQFAIEKYISSMKGRCGEEGFESKTGAIDLLGFLYTYLYDRYFKDHENISIRDIISGLDDAFGHAYQSLGYEEYQLDNMSPIDVEHESNEHQPQ